MRRVGFLLGALLLLALWVMPALAQGSFADVPLEHWAYDSVNRLAEAGIVEGYPPNYDFRGSRALTRYEMAMIIARALDYVDKNYCKKADCGGGPGPDLSKYVTKDELAAALANIKPGGGASQADVDKLKADLDKLQRAFDSEIRKINGRLDSLEERVTALEEKEPAGLPKISLSGDLRWRVGLYGNSLKLTGEVSGYPWAPPEAGPFSDLSGNSKDAVKAPKFSTMRARLVAAGEVNENVSVKVELFSDTRNNIGEMFMGEGIVNFLYPPNSANNFFPSGLMSTVRINEAYAKIKTSAWVPLTVQLGQSYFGWGSGLLVNNDLDPAVMKSAVVTFGDEGGWQLTGIGGMLDRESFYGRAARDILSPDPYYQFGSDGYDAFRLAIPLGKDLTIGGNWLASGADTENGWSVDLAGKLFGRKIWAEYAKLLEDFNNDEELTGGDTAWVAGIKLVDSASLGLSAQYGEVDSDYFVALSLLDPYSQYAADYIDWADRPLFLSKDNVAKGWEVCAELPRLFGEGNNVKIRYYDGKQYDWFGPEGSWMDADAVWTVTWTRALAANADFSLMYGQRETKNVLRVMDTENQDSMKTLRAEFTVRF